MSPETLSLIARAVEVTEEARELIQKHHELTEQARLEQTIHWEFVLTLRRLKLPAGDRSREPAQDLPRPHNRPTLGSRLPAVAPKDLDPDHP